MESFWGEVRCGELCASGNYCKSKSYFRVGDTLRCGTHSRNCDRIELRKNPDAKKLKEEKDSLRFSRALLASKSGGRRGQIVCSKLGMRKEVPHKDGYLSVFPNYKHGNRKDGYGCPALSPMSLGPIKHEQEGVPVFSNLENFWQFSKKYKNQSFKEFEVLRVVMSNAEPLRHNRKGEKPEGWVWDGELLDYLEARPYYCCFYEQLSRRTKEFTELKEYLNKGWNLNIIGYDGREVDGNSKEDFKRCYLDSTRPFGHELCLTAMLVLDKDDLPWRWGKYCM